ncbi:MAG TPA: flagellar export chaperone FliS [Leptospiraceae bacterium]|nr:flagellar export chaperone FliS [Leptospiraceae bacterium]HMX34498.1 flagellar export chaperone FliS [Leptospiraceae bacterium]HMY31129.1 flagellar export chaperone FliS [Leptospiraceae bacterium]HMZ63712.1 flagellar export chaperone FliS [Leptospiraceae bacterium]HNA09055.1 flagellar export chaperone FliS [Leptospiraceae bacterium]
MSLSRKSAYSSGYDAYKSNEISTMSQGKLVVMLYEGAIRFLNTAIENMTPRKYEIVNRNVIKAQDIVTELMTSLNMEEGGKIAEDLLSLYIYMKKRMLEGNIQKDSKYLKEVVRMLTELKGSWEEIAKKENTVPATPVAARPAGGFSIKG